MSAINELAAALVRAGTPPGTRQMALAIMGAESTWQYADQDQVRRAIARTLPPGSYPGLANFPNGSAGGGPEISIGPAQINVLAHPSYSPFSLAVDADYTVQAMADVSGQWTNFRPWSTYTSGAYIRYEAQAAQALSGNPTAGSVPGIGAPGSVTTVSRPLRKAYGLVGNPEEVGTQLPGIIAGAVGLLAIIVRPVRSFIERIMRDLFGIADNAVKFIWSADQSLISDVNDLAGWAWDEFGNLVDTLNGVAHSAGSAVGSSVVGAVKIAEDYTVAVAGELVTDIQRAQQAAYDRADQIGQEVLHDAETLYNRAVAHADTLAHELVVDIQTAQHALDTEIRTIADELVGDIQRAQQALDTEIKTTASQLVHDIQVAEQAAYDFARHEVRSFDNAVVEPLIGRVSPWLDWLGHVAITIVETVGKLLWWIVWLDLHAVREVIDTGVALAELSWDDTADVAGAAGAATRRFVQGGSLR